MIEFMRMTFLEINGIHAVQGAIFVFKTVLYGKEIFITTWTGVI